MLLQYWASVRPTDREGWDELAKSVVALQPSSRLSIYMQSNISTQLILGLYVLKLGLCEKFVLT